MDRGERPDHDRLPRAGGPGAADWTLYMDESGKAGDREGHYVLGCLAGDAGAIARVADRLYYLKRGMATERDPDSWEVHASRIMSRRSPIGTRTERKKLAAIGAFVDTICESDVALFGAAIVNELAHRHERDVGMRYALTFVLERYELLLRSRGPNARGRVVSDMVRRGTGTRLDRIFSSTMRGSNPVSHTLPRQITGMEYVSSESSPPVQLADVVAHTMRRSLEGDARFVSMSEKLMGSMWRDGEWHGWKTFSVEMGAQAQPHGRAGLAAP